MEKIDKLLETLSQQGDILMTDLTPDELNEVHSAAMQTSKELGDEFKRVQKEMLEKMEKMKKQDRHDGTE